MVQREVFQDVPVQVDQPFEQLVHSVRDVPVHVQPQMIQQSFQQAPMIQQSFQQPMVQQFQQASVRTPVAFSPVPQ